MATRWIQLLGERPQAQRLRSAARWLRRHGGGRMGEGGGMVGSSQRDARSSSLQRMVRPLGVSAPHECHISVVAWLQENPRQETARACRESESNGRGSARG